MEAFAEPAASPEEETPVRDAIGYLSNRLQPSPTVSNTSTPRALAHELPIGSGLIESGHKHALHARLKQAGSAWLADNAHSIAQLRIIRANHQWDDFWLPRKAA